MIANIPDRFRTWLFDTFTYESGQQAADAMADATRWGWLPALSGVAVGGEHARRSHNESVVQGSGVSG
ncbi:hypothetical protein [Pseudarthrobacter scleromae]|jgi:hypothetical protein|uniref:Uncharacterized protein n=1 Tax=Pseudarthrobacter scleromae TaxID=158897 RepID=A0ABQ2CQU6_9MICC|nr:hypothetical protein [Pseudarthrobacter scleromae]GGI95487.1 hypothetical protein GCM10007175_36430 [Pseudarthrobacter scleromae]